MNDDGFYVFLFRLCFFSISHISIQHDFSFSDAFRAATAEMTRSLFQFFSLRFLLFRIYDEITMKNKQISDAIKLFNRIPLR